ncbi:MAG: aldehyde dehydrogenase [Aeromicrobium sp.]|nr:aldehyde dehydrogenase [Aeromicrobium sp.]
MADAATEYIVNVLGPSGEYSSLDKAGVSDVTGKTIAQLSLAPIPYVNRAIAALRKSRPLPVDARNSALKSAAREFRSGIIDGLTRHQYEHLVSRASGVPITAVHQATDNIADVAETAYDRAEAARPRGAVADLDRVPDSGSGFWVRRGTVFGVHAAGNHPAVHAHWLEAVALGYAVAVRPSRREPFTPRRLIAALRTAGFTDQLAFLPTDYEAADAIIRGVDLAMVYGGDEVMAKYAGTSRVLTQGPGRSKILITADVDWHDYIDLIVDSVSQGGGIACTNTTAVFVEGDPIELARAVGAKLKLTPGLPPEHPEARLPVTSVRAARTIAEYLRRVAEGSTAVLGADDVVEELGDGSAVMHPSVHVVTSPSAKAVQTELSFPCLWVAPWKREDGIGSLGDTLALTVIGADDALVEQLLESPAIHNVYIGSHPTYWSGFGAPHDGYLGEFLMSSKAVIR